MSMNTFAKPKSKTGSERSHGAGDFQNYVTPICRTLVGGGGGGGEGLRSGCLHGT